MPDISFDVTTAGRDAVDIRWGGDYHAQMFHYKIHPNATRSEKNPCLLYVHSGGGNREDAKMPFVASRSANFMVSRILSNAKFSKYAVVSVNTPQYCWPLNDADYTGGIRRFDELANTHTQADLPWTMVNDNEPVTAGAMFEQLKVFILVLKSRADEFGIDPNRIFLMGSSFGAVRSMMSQISGPLESDKLTTSFRTQYGIKPGVDSKVRGIINHFGCVDFRLNTEIMRDFYGTSVTNAGKSINDMGYTNRYVGVHSTKELAALPSWHTEQLSLLWYLEQNHQNLKYLPPMYHFYEFIGQEYSRRFIPAQAVTIANGGSGFTQSDVGTLISIDGTVGRGSEKLKIRITQVNNGSGTGAVTQATTPSLDLYCGSYRLLPGQQRDATTGAFLNTFAAVSCVRDTVGDYYGGSGTRTPDTVTASGSGLSVNLGGLTVRYDEKTATSYNGGNMWPAVDPHDDILMRMVQRTLQKYDSQVQFRYGCALDTEVTDTGGGALKAKAIALADDIESWMEAVTANAPLTGPSPCYYGDYFPRANEQLPVGWQYPVATQTDTTLRKVTYPFPTNWYM
jgi:predicted esterase